MGKHVNLENFKYKLGDKLKKTKGSQWKGTVVGFYSTELTPEGYAIESSTEKGSVQIYPVGALEEYSKRSVKPKSKARINDLDLTAVSITAARELEGLFKAARNFDKNKRN